MKESTKESSKFEFFGKLWNFYFRPKTMFTELLKEPAERTLAAIIPLWVLVILLSHVINSVMGEAGGGSFFRGMSVPVIYMVIAVIVYVLAAHGFMLLFGGKGKMLEMFTAAGYVAVFSNIIPLLISFIAVMSAVIAGAPVLLFGIGLPAAILQIWGFVSTVIGFRVVHQLGVIRTLLGIVLGSLVGVLFYFESTYGLLYMIEGLV